MSIKISFLADARQLTFYLFLTVCFLTLCVVAPLPSAAQSAVSPEALYQSLLKSTPTNLPPGFSSASTLEIGNADKGAGLVGEIDLIFKGDDPKARLGYFVFTDFNAASEFNRKHLPGVIPGQKLLAYPPFARCADIPNVGGYCDMWIEDYSVIMVASASNKDGAASLMGVGFKHLGTVHDNLARQVPPVTPSGVDPCSLVTKAEVENALNETVGQPQRDRVGGCFWQSMGGNSLTVQAFNTGRIGFDAAKSRTFNTVALPGIGDDAFGFVSLAGFVQISLIKNNHYVAITLQNQRNPVQLETAKALATKIANRL
jgi:hypothetical protein